MQTTPSFFEKTHRFPSCRSSTPFKHTLAQASTWLGVSTAGLVLAAPSVKWRPCRPAPLAHGRVSPPSCGPMPPTASTTETCMPWHGGRLWSHWCILRWNGWRMEPWNWAVALRRPWSWRSEVPCGWLCSGAFMWSELIKKKKMASVQKKRKWKKKKSSREMEMEMEMRAERGAGNMNCGGDGPR